MYRSCSYRGVSHVEGSGRHVLTYDEAKALCEELGAELATEEQLDAAYNSNMETCRYGWTANMTIAILRHTPREKCALNMTGLLIKPYNTTGLYDTYCFEPSDTSEKNCKTAFNLHSQNDVNGSEPAATDDTGIDEGVGATDGPEDDTDGLLDVLDEGNATAATAGPAQHGEITEGVAETEVPTHGPQPTAEEGVFGERWFTSEGPSDEDQGTRPTQVTNLLLPDDTTGSGIQPTSEDTEAPAAETHKPTMETPEPQPELRPGTKTVPSGGERNMTPNMGYNEKQEEKASSDWLVIIGVVVAIAAILLVCGIVATRKRWCGKHQTLNISKGGGEGNGAAGAVASSRDEEREQEMVTLMNKEKIQENGNAEELTAITVEGSSEKA
ncbi:hypothetical protein ACEWY4_010944 [Coilia grayii]|uniref:CD44 antigen n=1 Tax=Coilia grayii TaxID=363190 RepID=A0ABD1K3D3_9TELE